MANKKRLIDANCLVGKFYERKEFFLNKLGGFQALLKREKGMVDELNNCIADVINAQTVDAVEVVRCRECKSYDEECGYCESMGFTCKFDDFCSYGEKRINGKAD